MAIYVAIRNLLRNEYVVAVIHGTQYLYSDQSGLVFLGNVLIYPISNFDFRILITGSTSGQPRKSIRQRIFSTIFRANS